MEGAVFAGSFRAPPLFTIAGDKFCGIRSDRCTLFVNGGGYGEKPGPRPAADMLGLPRDLVPRLCVCRRLHYMGRRARGAKSLTENASKRGY